MPELPEVEIVKRSLENSILGHRIKTCKINCEKLRFSFSPNFKTIMTGARINNIRRRGKHMVLLLSSAANTDKDTHAMIWHLGMSGRVKILHGEDAAQYAPEKHDHVIFETEIKTANPAAPSKANAPAKIIYNDARRFGFMTLHPAQDWQTVPPFHAMGPEPLDNSFNGQVLHARLKGKKTNIKTALLDQRIVAGIGNIYACEALYMSGIHPETYAGKLTRSQCDTLSIAIRDVLNKALAAGGSSLKDYHHTDGSLGYFQHSFSVYDREGQPCPNCNCDCTNTGGIQRITQGGRSTFFCPNTQKK